MEQAFFLFDKDQIHQVGTVYSRLYFGSETCEHLLPSTSDIIDVYSVAREKNVNFTLVTPWLGQKGLKRLHDVFAALDDEKILGGIEVVVNDWGALRLLNECTDNRPRICLGRLLNKQCTDPRLSEWNESATVSSQYCHSSADNETVLDFVKHLGVVRLEYNNPLHGVQRATKFPASLYHPYFILSVSRICPVANWHHNKRFREIGPCKMECRQGVFELKYEFFSRKVFFKGCGQFMCNPQLPVDMSNLGFDRIVQLPDPVS